MSGEQDPSFVKLIGFCPKEPPATLVADRVFEPSADIASLALIAREMITGKPAQSHARGLPPVHFERPGVGLESTHFDAILRRALRADPGEGYADIKELVRDLVSGLDAWAAALYTAATLPG